MFVVVVVVVVFFSSENFSMMRSNKAGIRNGNELIL